MDFIRLFLLRTPDAVELLKELYHEDAEVLLILRLLVRAVAISLDLYSNYCSLLETLLNNPEEFQRIILLKINDN